MPFVSQIEIDHLAGRIERAFLRRGAPWYSGCSTYRVWTAAARNLLQCRIDDPESPIDPELYVAAQGIDADNSDPWLDLASPKARECYAEKVRSIVGLLRAELTREIRRAERSIREGRTAGDVLTERNIKLSPLARYIVARRALRDDLAERWSGEALAQHRSCPLYREASQALLPIEQYPSEADSKPIADRGSLRTACSLN